MPFFCPGCRRALALCPALRQGQNGVRDRGYNLFTDQPGGRASYCKIKEKILFTLYTSLLSPLPIQTPSIEGVLYRGAKSPGEKVLGLAASAAI